MLPLHDEFEIVAMDLDRFHGVFSALWRIGVPTFTTDIKTAAIVFAKGKPISFLFNPDFWKSLDTYNRSMVICHELLHVLLQHGERGKDAKNHGLANIAMDVVVNHTLVASFGFDRAKITDSQNLCWVDTVFKGDADAKERQPYEYYYQRLLDKQKQQKQDLKASGGTPGNGEPTQAEGSSEAGGARTLDDHDKWDTNDPDDIKKSVQDALQDNLSSEEAQDFVDKIKNTGLHAGGEVTSVEALLAAPKIVIKKKWETVIKRWARHAVRDDDNEQWARLHRRLSLFSAEKSMLPSDHEEERFKRDMVLVYFFLDSSGSCSHLKDRFFRAALSLDPEKFDIKLFSFDTSVYPANLKDKKIRGGGGTSFHIMEERVQNDIANATMGKYPDAVFVITDGYGSHMSVQYPKKWYWFLTGTYRNYIPTGSYVFRLADFEYLNSSTLCQIVIQFVIT